MVYCPESDSLMFVGTPALNGLESLTSRGLFISDIPLHDATRDVILVGEQARAQVIFQIYALIKGNINPRPVNVGNRGAAMKNDRHFVINSISVILSRGYSFRILLRTLNA